MSLHKMINKFPESYLKMFWQLLWLLTTHFSASLKLCPSDSLKVMICLISTYFTTAASASCIYLCSAHGQIFLWTTKGWRLPQHSFTWAFWQLFREWKTKERYNLEKLHTEFWINATSRSRSNSKSLMWYEDMCH